MNTKSYLTNCFPVSVHGNTYTCNAIWRDEEGALVWLDCSRQLQGGLSVEISVYPSEVEDLLIFDEGKLL